MSYRQHARLEVQLDHKTELFQEKISRLSLQIRELEYKTLCKFRSDFIGLVCFFRSDFIGLVWLPGFDGGFFIISVPM